MHRKSTHDGASFDSTINISSELGGGISVDIAAINNLS
jgi:hypothetical protein